MRMGTYYRYLAVHRLKLPISGKKILDIGGYDGYLLSRVSSEKKFCIDLKPFRKYSNIKYIEGNFLNYDFENTRFDRIFAFDVLEHVNPNDEKKFLKKAIKLLDKKGIFVWSIPSKSIKVFPPILQSWIDNRWEHAKRRGYSLNEIKKFLTLLGNGDCIQSDVFSWNCPFFRFFYLPLSLFWRVSQLLAKIMSNFIIEFDSWSQIGEKGFFFIVISKEIRPNKTSVLNLS